MNEVSNQTPTANKSKFIPWPTDFYAYLTALPGVKVIQGPENVTIGGIQGSQIIMDTPILHPILWLKDDFTWLGGGETGFEQASRRYMILLNVHGEHYLLKFDDDPTTFDAHYPLVQEIFNSIKFGK